MDKTGLVNLAQETQVCTKSTLFNNTEHLLLEIQSTVSFISCFPLQNFVLSSEKHAHFLIAIFQTNAGRRGTE